VSPAIYEAPMLKIINRQETDVKVLFAFVSFWRLVLFAFFLKSEPKGKTPISRGPPCASPRFGVELR